MGKTSAAQLAAQARWRAKNPERVLAWGRDWRKRNKVKLRAKKKAWKKANPDKMRGQRLKYKYRLTLIKLEAMLAAQDGKCACCPTPLTTKEAAVDHCHASGAVRGILCRRCNSALGWVKDDPATLRRLASYLEK